MRRRADRRKMRALPAVMRPPAVRTSPSATKSPSPTPCTASLVVKNGSKMRDRISAGMPGPLSVTSMRTSSIDAGDGR